MISNENCSLCTCYPVKTNNPISCLEDGRERGNLSGNHKNKRSTKRELCRVDCILYLMMISLDRKRGSSWKFVFA